MRAKQLGYAVAAAMTVAALVACGNSDTDGSGDAGAAGTAAGGTNGGAGAGGFNFGGANFAGSGQAGAAMDDSVIATGFTDIKGLVVDATSAYVMSPAGIQKVALGGGAPTMIGAALKQARGLAVDGNAVYWLDDAKVMKAGLGGENPTALYAPADGIFSDGLVVHGDFAYASLIGGAVSGIVQIPLAGGDAKSIVPGPTQDLLGVDDSGLYWNGFDVSAPTAKSLVHSGFDGAAPVTLTSFDLLTEGQAYGFFADGTSAYYIFRPKDQKVSLNQGFKVPSAGGDPVKLFEVHDDAEEIVVAGAKYVINDQQTGKRGLYAVDAGGASTQIYAQTNDQKAKFIRYANGKVYWADDTTIHGKAP